MASLAHITTTSVVETLELMRDLLEVSQDELDGLLDLHGYSTRPAAYRVTFEGRSYPAKAVLGIAGGLASRDFFGGVAQAVPCLQRLGFQVVRDGTPVAALGLERLVQEAELEGRRAFRPDLHVEPAAIFASGTNRPGEIRGLAARGADIGVAALELNREAIDELKKLAGTDVNVFVDSGAFGEVDFTEAGPQVVRPFTDEDWRRVFAVYAELTAALGSQVWIVAPDRVGCQDTTLLRLDAYAGSIVALADAGARVIVPVQVGAMSLADFARRIDDKLGADRWVPGLPCKKAATSPEAVADFVYNYAPRHVHLLGMGARNRRVNEYLAPFEGLLAPSVSLDANWITANVGRQGKARAYTRGRDFARKVLGMAAAPALVAELALLAALA